MERLTPEQRRLKRLHKTPDEFARDVMECLGEISLEEANAAVAKYRKEWEAAAPQRQWIKILVQVNPAYASLEDLCWKWTRALEDEFDIPQLYFARYTGTGECRFEVSANTTATLAELNKFTAWFEGKPMGKWKAIRKIEVQPRGTGSAAHAFAYQAVKRLKPVDVEMEGPNDNEFIDLLHWMCNMRGMDYIREIRYYGFAAMVFADLLVRKSEEELRRLNKPTAKGKARASARRSNHGRPRPPAKSAPAAARKAPGSSRSPSAGSSPR